jgi:hypothetical protein
VAETDQHTLKMKNKSFTQIILGCLAITGAFLLLRFATGGSTANASCKESMETCCHKDDGGSKMIWENLSHQFFSSF